MFNTCALHIDGHIQRESAVMPCRCLESLSKSLVHGRSPTGDASSFRTLGVTEVMVLLGVSRTTLWRMRRRCSDFPKPRRSASGRWVFVRAALMEWQETHAQVLKRKNGQADLGRVSPSTTGMRLPHTTREVVVLTDH